MAKKRELPILYVVQIGSDEFQRYLIRDQEERFGTGESFDSEDRIGNGPMRYRAAETVEDRCGGALFGAQGLRLAVRILSVPQLVRTSLESHPGVTADLLATSAGPHGLTRPQSDIRRPHSSPAIRAQRYRSARMSFFALSQPPNRQPRHRKSRPLPKELTSADRITARPLYIETDRVDIKVVQETAGEKCGLVRDITGCGVITSGLITEVSVVNIRPKRPKKMPMMIRV